MFNYYQQPPDPYGFSRINNSQPMTTYEFLRTAEESTRGAFQSIEHVASAFLSIASLLNSTYGAVFNSFRAIISVVEQLKSLKHFLVSTFLLSLTRWIRFLWRRLLASLRVRPRNYANSASIWAGINGELEQSKKSSNFGTLIFWIIAIGGPLLIIKYFLQQIRENARELTSDWATGQAEHYTAQAKIFLSFDTLRIAPKQKQPDIKDWLLASNSDGSKIGLVPINYIRILDHNNNPN
uniref:Peroxin-13 n=1 Tax=Meloidogyne incognita TaxID=6306 RepID=A0A914L2Q2_MELIC